jgi:formylglycine-generating enzyme required for sulfatase activity
MVFVPGGTYTMGSFSGARDEQPAHTVTLSPFCIDRTEVSVASFRTCVDARQCDSTAAGAQCNGLSSERADHPINCVTWSQARSLCTSRGARLPTEAEWEFAARSSDERTFPWGNDSPGGNLCWGRDGVGTCPVGAFPSGTSPFGALDMAGNVWEWVEDWYAERYPSEALRNPAGPAVGRYRVVRGGSWADGVPARVRSTRRDWNLPTMTYAYVGFRCAAQPRYEAP